MDRREKIIRDFSRWAAASAARQGSDIRGRKWYEHIEKIKLDKLLAVEFDCLPEKFGEWHREEVETLAKESGSVIGWAAKIVNMVTKVQIHIAQRGNQGVLKLIHPPIDNQLIDAIKKKYPKNGFNAHNNFELRQLCDSGKPISDIKTYDHYSKVIRGLRLVAAREGCSLFEVESLWTG